MAILYTKIVGVTQKNDDGADRQKILKKCKKGELVTLIRDPKNAYDKNAIKICRESGGQLGWIDAGLAINLSLAIDLERYSMKGEIANLTGGGGKTRGCNLKMTIDEIPIQRRIRKCL